MDPELAARAAAALAASRGLPPPRAIINVVLFSLIYSTILSTVFSSGF